MGTARHVESRYRRLGLILGLLAIVMHARATAQSGCSSTQSANIAMSAINATLAAGGAPLQLGGAGVNIQLNEGDSVGGDTTDGEKLADTSKQDMGPALPSEFFITIYPSRLGTISPGCECNPNCYVAVVMHELIHIQEWENPGLQPVDSLCTEMVVQNLTLQKLCEFIGIFGLFGMSTDFPDLSVLGLCEVLEHEIQDWNERYGSPSTQGILCPNLGGAGFPPSFVPVLLPCPYCP